MKNYILILLGFIVVACAPMKDTEFAFGDNNASLTHLEDCTHKYDDGRNFIYVVELSELYIVNETLSVYKFVTPDGDEVFINNYEKENYSCERIE